MGWGCTCTSPCWLAGCACTHAVGGVGNLAPRFPYVIDPDSRLYSVVHPVVHTAAYGCIIVCTSCSTADYSGLNTFCILYSSLHRHQTQPSCTWPTPSASSSSPHLPLLYRPSCPCYNSSLLERVRPSSLVARSLAVPAVKVRAPRAKRMPPPLRPGPRRRGRGALGARHGSAASPASSNIANLALLQRSLQRCRRVCAPVSRPLAVNTRWVRKWAVSRHGRRRRCRLLPGHWVVRVRVLGAAVVIAVAVAAVTAESCRWRGWEL